MVKKLQFSLESFEKLLAWLDPDREIAGEKYEEIHFKLSKIFARRGCNNPEELADDTIDRVMQKVAQVAPSYEGDPALYFYGVAKKVFHEYTRKRPEVQPPTQACSPDHKEQLHECLDECLARCGAENQRFVLRYYQGEKDSKIRGRKELADSLGITVDALRVRVTRLKVPLRKCMKECLTKNE